MSKTTAIVWIFDSHTEAEAGIKDLHGHRFDVRQLSIIGRDYQTEERVAGFYKVGERVKVWGRNGALWGGLWGLFIGATLSEVRGLSPLMGFDPLLTWIVGALEGAVVVGGLSALGAALYGIGIPKNSVLRYESVIRANMFVLVASGTVAEVATAQALLAMRHDASSRTRTLEESAAAVPPLAAVAMGTSR